jgi:hypothetical protein
MSYVMFYVLRENRGSMKQKYLLFLIFEKIWFALCTVFAILAP